MNDDKNNDWVVGEPWHPEEEAPKDPQEEVREAGEDITRESHYIAGLLRDKAVVLAKANPGRVDIPRSPYDLLVQGIRLSGHEQMYLEHTKTPRRLGLLRLPFFESDSVRPLRYEMAITHGDNRDDDAELFLGHSMKTDGLKSFALRWGSKSARSGNLTLRTLFGNNSFINDVLKYTEDCIAPLEGRGTRMATFELPEDPHGNIEVRLGMMDKRKPVVFGTDGKGQFGLRDNPYKGLHDIHPAMFGEHSIRELPVVINRISDILPR